MTYLIIDLQNLDCMHITAWKQLWVNLHAKSKQLSKQSKQLTAFEHVI